MILFHKFRKDLLTEMERQKENLAAGCASDYAAYQLRVGVIKGMKEALEMAETVFKGAQDDDDSEYQIQSGRERNSGITRSRHADSGGGRNGHAVGMVPLGKAGGASDEDW